MTLLSFDRIQAAQKVLSAKLAPTPLLSVCDEQLVGKLWLKCESLQPTGSFKIRGATYRISQLSPQQKAAGVVAYSTGNHAQAVAKAAADAGIASTVVMSPVTIACELATQLALANTTVFVPIGGGGLIAGVATGLKSIAPMVRVVGVEPELKNDAALSFKRGSIVTAPGPSESIADAIKIQALGELTFPTIQAYVDDIIEVWFISMPLPSVDEPSTDNPSMVAETAVNTLLQIQHPSGPCVRVRLR